MKLSVLGAARYIVSEFINLYLLSGADIVFYKSHFCLKLPFIFGLVDLVATKTLFALLLATAIKIICPMN